MTALIVLWLLFAHLIGDFFLQTDEMATKKSTSWLHLFDHVLVYTVALSAFSAVILSFPVRGWLLFWSLNGILHFVTDAVTSRCTAYLWKREERHWFFVMIGVDQFIHASCLILTYEALR